MPDYRVIDIDPDLSEATFTAILREVGSPALSSAHAVYQYCVARRVSPAFILALFQHESRFGKAGTATITHSWGNTRLPVHGGVLPVRQTGPDEARSGTFPVFRDWIDGGRATVARLVDYAPYAGKMTVGQVVPTWAPASDGNDPGVYVRAVTTAIAAWQARENGAANAAKEATMLLTKPPMTDAPSPNHGYPGDYKPEIITWHITAGSGASAFSWLRNPDSNASSNYLNMESGEIKQLVNPENGQQGAAWANGDVQNPNMANLSIASYVKAGININRRCVSVENAGQSSYGKGGSLTSAQVASLVNLTAWLCKRFGIPPDRDHIVPHAWINDVTRHNCPGFSEAEWSKWIGMVAALVNGTTGKVPLVDDTKEDDVTVPAEGKTEVQIINGQAVVVTNYGPPERDVVSANVNTVDQGVTMTNRRGNQYNRSQQRNVMGAFTAIPK